MPFHEVMQANILKAVERLAEARKMMLTAEQEHHEAQRRADALKDRMARAAVWLRDEEQEFERTMAGATNSLGR